MASQTDREEQELTVKGESIESIYRQYRQNKYWVNRRYQRKLIWTLEEKQSFIDSVARGLPVPIVLLAASASREPSALEIIDGMQRLNAVVSFIENDYLVGDGYFDLNTMAVTKELLDAGTIRQKEPILDRGVCVNIASYALPVSIFEFTDGAAVDDVFRRINSGGRKLSRQELRTAGATGHFATAVRRIAAQVRGDDSYSDTLRLNDMAAISITNKELSYGILVDTIFWVSQNILTKEQVRESRDEEVIADILAYMVLPQPPSSRSELFDEYYGLRDDEAAQRRFGEVELAVQKRSVELVVSDFTRTLDAIRITLAESRTSFGKLLFEQQPARAPRYFQVVFLAFYTLLIRNGLSIVDKQKLITRMTNQSKHIAVPEGGRWGGEDRHQAVQATAGMYREAFGQGAATDPSTIHWITRIENLLSQSLTEQSLFDFKQGFIRLDGSGELDEKSFNKILKICAAIANNRRGCRGYVLVGICEKVETAAKIKEQLGVEPRRVFNFLITGVEHEASALGKNSDQMFQMIVDRISRSALSSPLKEYVARNLKPIRYFEKTIYVFEVEGQDDPSTFSGRYFDRRGAQLEEVSGERLAPFMRRYITGR
jgi:Protein of unknown function DUF262